MAKKIKLFLLLLTLIFLNINAQFAGGSGTEVDPYQISNRTQLDSVRNYLSSNFIITQDFGMGSNTFMPIGTLSAPFTGSLDGNNKRIYGMMLTPYSVSTHTDYFGMFAYISGANIHNLILDDSEFNNFYGVNHFQDAPQMKRTIYAGILAGRSLSSTIDSVIIKSPFLYIANYRTKQYSSDLDVYAYMGGLIGYNANGTITNSFVRSASLGRDWSLQDGGFGYPDGFMYCSGLIGYNSNGTISKSSFNGSFYVEGTDGSESVISGLIGKSIGGSISNTYVISSIAGWDARGDNYYYSGLIGTGTTNISYSYSILNPTNISSEFLNGFLATVELGFFNGSLWSGIPTSCVTTQYYSKVGADQGKFNSSVIYGTLTQLKDQAFFTSKGFNFVSIWAINSTFNSGYPFISSLAPDHTIEAPGYAEPYYPSNNSINVVINPLLKWKAPTSGGAPDYYEYEVREFLPDIIVATGITTDLQIQLSSILDYDTHYYWAVNAINSAGESGFSSYINFTTLNNPSSGGLTVPTLIKPENDTTLALSYSFLWSEVNSATGYQIKYINTDNFITEIDTIVSDTTVTITNVLDSGIKYSWQVRANNATDTSLWTNKKYFTIAQTTPDTLVFITPVANSTNSIVNSSYIKWNNDYNVDYAKITIIDTLASDTLIFTKNMPDTTILISQYNGFNSSTWYSIQGKNYNSVDSSSYTTLYYFKTAGEDVPDPPDPPLPPIFSDIPIGGGTSSSTLILKNIYFENDSSWYFDDFADVGSEEPKEFGHIRNDSLYLATGRDPYAAGGGLFKLNMNNNTASMILTNDLPSNWWGFTNSSHEGFQGIFHLYENKYKLFSWAYENNNSFWHQNDPALYEYNLASNTYSTIFTDDLSDLAQGYASFYPDIINDSLTYFGTTATYQDAWVTVDYVSNSRSYTVINTLTGLNTGMPNYRYYVPTGHFNLADTMFVYLSVHNWYPDYNFVNTEGYPAYLAKHPNSSAKNSDWILEEIPASDSLTLTPQIYVNRNDGLAYILRSHPQINRKLNSTRIVETNGVEWGDINKPLYMPDSMYIVNFYFPRYKDGTVDNNNLHVLWGNKGNSFKTVTWLTKLNISSKVWSDTTWNINIVYNSQSDTTNFGYHTAIIDSGNGRSYFWHAQIERQKHSFWVGLYDSSGSNKDKRLYWIYKEDLGGIIKSEEKITNDYLIIRGIMPKAGRGGGN